MPATPSRRPSSPPASPSISAATVSPRAPACSTALHRQPASLFQIDEFGQFLGSIVDKRRAPKHLAEIWDLLTELSTSAGSTFFGAEYADQKLKPRQDIIQPCCAIHATTVPETFWTDPAQRLPAGRQPGPLPHLPQHRRHSRPQPCRRRCSPTSRQPLIDALKSVAAGAPRLSRGKPRRHRGAHRHARSLSGADGAGRPAAVRGAGRRDHPPSASGHRLQPRRGAGPGVGEHRQGGADQGGQRRSSLPDDPPRGRRMGARRRRPLRRHAADRRPSGISPTTTPSATTSACWKSFAAPATQGFTKKRPHPANAVSRQARRDDVLETLIELWPDRHGHAPAGSKPTTVYRVMPW